MSEYFPKPHEPFGRDINVKVDLLNYATKKAIKNITHVDTLNFALKTNVAILKNKVHKLDIDKLKSLPTKVDKLDTDKLETVPVDLSKLTNVVKMKLLKKLNIMLR